MISNISKVSKQFSFEATSSIQLANFLIVTNKEAQVYNAYMKNGSVSSMSLLPNTYHNGLTGYPLLGVHGAGRTFILAHGIGYTTDVYEYNGKPTHFPNV